MPLPRPHDVLIHCACKFKKNSSVKVILQRCLLKWNGHFKADNNVLEEFSRSDSIRGRKGQMTFQAGILLQIVISLKHYLIMCSLILGIPAFSRCVASMLFCSKIRVKAPILHNNSKLMNDFVSWRTLVPGRNLHANH